MVDVVNNSVNSYNNMKVQKPQVGILTPSGSSTKKPLYSDAEAGKRFKELNKQMVLADQKEEYNNKKKTYGGIILSIGVVVAGTLLLQKKVLAKIKDIKLPKVFKRKI